MNELREKAKMVFSKAPAKATMLPILDNSKIQMLESNQILQKKIIGKTDVDIAALIKKLENSDWVQQGQQYFNQLEDRCPFCQQKTDAAFRQNLEDYFDQSYSADLDAIEKLLVGYEDAVKELMDACCVPSIVDSLYLERDAYESDVASLRLMLEANIERIKAKIKEPSASVTLNKTALMFDAIAKYIEVANRKVGAHNNMVGNLAAEKKRLISQIWKKLLENTEPAYTQFKSQCDDLNKAITALEEKIQKSTAELEAKKTEIEENEKKITSIKPTIAKINKYLKSFGFVNFSLKGSNTKNGFYEVKRPDPDGSDAKQTLSEGEKSFITFLYFYCLVDDGSFSSSGSTKAKVIVFDDPVSSLDTDILFIVCNLIKDIIYKMRTGSSQIKQVFVLTHNIYFHKEVTFDTTRSEKIAKADETFWIIRKSSARSELRSSKENPIKSSYELLWQEVKRNPPSDTAIQNAMRRILEHYFKYYGGKKPKDIIDKFDGKDKIICNTMLSWINDGSHFATDDLYVACDSVQVNRYRSVFRKIFEASGHDGHYKMMMGDDYVVHPIAANDDGAKATDVAEAVKQ